MNYLSRFAPLLGLFAVYGLFAILGPDSFSSGRNLETIARQTAIVGTAALGMTLVIIAGGIDLSVGSIIALTTVTIAASLQADLSPPVRRAHRHTHRCAVRPCQRPDHHPFSRRAFYRHTRHALTRARHCQRTGWRTENRRPPHLSHRPARSTSTRRMVDIPARRMAPNHPRPPHWRIPRLYPSGQTHRRHWIQRKHGSPVRHPRRSHQITRLYPRRNIRRHSRAPPIFAPHRRRSHGRCRPRTRCHRSRCHRRGQPLGRRRLSTRQRGRRTDHDCHPLWLFTNGLAKLGARNRHRHYYSHRRSSR